ncbi:MAG: VapC toxin family PIN domain ribonuclease [Phormidesmis priestleyi]|uniref:Ribonuclease VapC n=1 Tax=Phormidesmis priestleyi TaxID=268141 RepID=A0A2W4WVK6_9CYAN|nr:MAG: VapC toxin family PIN domain ribonuclease [Phormidesmis priestleyi]
MYLDANIWIYALEPISDYSQPLATLFEADDAGSLTLVTSELSLAEILVRPIKKANIFEQETYAKAITSTDSLIVVPVNRSILIEAAATRANTKLKLPDAIHAASAIATGCTTFLTNDKQFRTVEDLHTLLISQVLTASDSDE